MSKPTETSHPFGERFLAAVMFTDVAGFSRLMEEKEDRALTAVHRDFDVMSALIQKAAGRVLKSLGDGLLVHFTSAVNAVACAQEIQCTLASAAAARTQGLSLQHRIGIHLGDVFLTPTDILGNGVNIAARLQTRAAPGGICISQTVYDVVKNKLVLQVNYLGAQELKNIRAMIPIYLVTPRVNPPSSPVPAQPLPAPAVAITLGPASGPRVAPRPPRPRDPGLLTIAVLGDFSGRGGRGVNEALLGRRAYHTDVDNFDEVFTRLQVRAGLPAYHHAGGTTEISLETIESFHPDTILQSVPELANLGSLRSALDHPASSAAARLKLRALLLPRPEVAPPETDDATLSRLLDRRSSSDLPAGQAPLAAPAGAIAAFLQPLLKAAATPAAPDPAAEREALDRELTAHLRAILHHPELQAIEALWRGLHLLVRDFGGEEKVKILLIDASRQELATRPAELPLFLKDYDIDLLVSDYPIGPILEDISFLTALAQAAAAQSSRLLAPARPELAGCESFALAPDPATWTIAAAPEVAAAWIALRRSSLAPHITLAAPRFLLRQPYGRRSDAIDSFPFEELTAERPHECYLWGNPALACAHVLASAHLNEESTSTATNGRLDDLPLHSFVENGATAVQASAETWLTERSARALESRGITALISEKNRNAVRITSLVSIA